MIEEKLDFSAALSPGELKLTSHTPGFMYTHGLLSLSRSLKNNNCYAPEREHLKMECSMMKRLISGFGTGTRLLFTLSVSLMRRLITAVTEGLTAQKNEVKVMFK